MIITCLSSSFQLCTKRGFGRTHILSLRATRAGPVLSPQSVSLPPNDGYDRGVQPAQPLLYLFNMSSPAGFIRAQSGMLTLHSKPFRYVGTNIYWLMTKAAEGDWGRRHVERALDECASRSLNIVRTWAFSEGDGYSLHQHGLRANERMLQERCAPTGFCR